MDFDFSDDQRLLRDSVTRLLADHYAFEQRTAYGGRPEGWSRTLWLKYAELGLFGLPFAEVDGGFGGDATDISIVMEAMGGALTLEPFLATLILAGGILRRAGTTQQKAMLIPEIVAGSLIMALAHGERHSRYDLSNIATVAARHDGGWTLNGEKSLVLHGDSADRLIVSARLDPASASDMSLFLVDPTAEGVSRRGYATQDGLRAAEISFNNVQLDQDSLLETPADPLSLIERVIDEAIVALCAEAIGAMAASLDITVDYLKSRWQFGRAIGSFQALQHQAADMFVALEQARSITYYATMMVSDGDDKDFRRAVSAAKLQVGRAAMSIGQKAIQLHGGVGMSYEYKIGHYFKRLTMINYLFGDSDHHLSKLARLGGLFDPSEDVP